MLFNFTGKDYLSYTYILAVLTLDEGLEDLVLVDGTLLAVQHRLEALQRRLLQLIVLVILIIAVLSVSLLMQSKSSLV